MKDSATFQRSIAAFIVLATVVLCCVVIARDYFIGIEPPAILVALLSAAFTGSIALLNLDKGVTLTNGDTLDKLITIFRQKDQPPPPTS